ncbi:hypothetical protein PHYSODRAFT_302824 [Phytophthora sojae]|uniref:Uncharacterized protein n=1 Tax=Phytophthora sojae (strain P6497) TaxID=1094619 RepID=G4ZSX7_PHYSP|nr:hypothetical protein PHYSODRAFT_302824 [Phytophthora sojae]EGZ13062.1 hypothetical protein PHYSODRAFT_302824 [Phytophthora sojae]|eukprot:XP_009530491.1 hypothetical protein PHYSODRAFT_302824 [Phytophthora sojae]
MQLEPTLASVRVVTGEHAEVEALCHVVQMLHEFVFPGYALVRAAEQGSFRLFTGTLRFVDYSSSLSHFEKLQHYRLAMHVVPTKMMPKQDALAAMEQLYQRHPESLDNESVSAILEACDLPMLQWLHRCKGSKVFTNGHRTEMILFDNASTLGRMDVVQWFVRTFPEVVCDLSCAAREGYVDQLKWLVENAKWNQSSIGWAASAAATSRLLNSWLQ